MSNQATTPAPAFVPQPPSVAAIEAAWQSASANDPSAAADAQARLDAVRKRAQEYRIAAAGLVVLLAAGLSLRDSTSTIRIFDQPNRTIVIVCIVGGFALGVLSLVLFLRAAHGGNKDFWRPQGEQPAEDDVSSILLEARMSALYQRAAFYALMLGVLAYVVGVILVWSLPAPSPN